LDTALCLTWSLIQDQILGIEDLCRLWSFAPASLFALPVNEFSAGSPADICIFNPDDSWTVQASGLASKGKNTPSMGQTLAGRVQAMMVQGRLVYARE
jgi:dihydroorotase